MKGIFLFPLFVFMATSVSAEIYTWTDSRGTAHYTNSMYEVPARFRDKVKVLTYDTDQKGDASSQNSRPQSGTVQTSSPVPGNIAAPSQLPPTAPPLNVGTDRIRRGGRRSGTSPVPGE